MPAASPPADAPTVLVVQPDPGDPPGRLGAWLIETGMRLDVRSADVRSADVDNPESGLPGDLAGYAGLVVLGGAACANDPAHQAALGPIRALLRAAVQDEVPTLAVCLGAQLLATAHGGRVERNPAGPEFGAQLIAKRAAAATDPLFRDLPITPDVVQWHFDAITQLPPGAVLLATSPMCEVQGFRLGRLAWGVQFHIESTPETVQTWAEQDAADLVGRDVAALLSRVRSIDPDIVEVWQPFVASFVTVMRDPGAVTHSRSIATAVAEPLTDPAAIRAALAAELSAARAPAGNAALPTPQLRRPDPPAGAEDSERRG